MCLFLILPIPMSRFLRNRLSAQISKSPWADGIGLKEYHKKSTEKSMGNFNLYMFLNPFVECICIHFINPDQING